MGSGKTKLGKRVARILGKPFVDTDRMVVAEHGTIADLFSQFGEAHFRSLERIAVEDALAQDAVVALGGGAILHLARANDKTIHAHYDRIAQWVVDRQRAADEQFLAQKRVEQGK